jgi:cell division protein FtsI/penicillin-binding protein 2
VLGFVNVDSQGLAGLERRLDKQIRGESQEVEVARDAHGRVFHKARSTRSRSRARASRSRSTRTCSR